MKSGDMTDRDEHQCFDAEDLCTPKHNRAPPGRILMNLRWRATSVAQSIQNHRPILSDNMGAADFQLGDDMVVLLLLERDLMCYSECERKLRLLHRSLFKRKVVVVLCTHLTHSSWLQLQPTAVIQLNIHTVPISSLDQLPAILQQLLSAATNVSSSGSCSNHQLQQLLTADRSGSCLQPDAALVQCLSHVPSVGPCRARRLFRELACLTEVARASQQQLAAVVGESAASALFSFLHSTTPLNTTLDTHTSPL